MIYFEIDKNTQEVLSGPWGSNELPIFSEESNIVATESLSLKVGWFYVDGLLEKPLSPNPSWIWSDSEESWSSPIPYPEGELNYDWNEELTNWVLVPQ